MTEKEAAAQAIHHSSIHQAWCNHGGHDDVAFPNLPDGEESHEKTILERYEAHVYRRICWYRETEKRFDRIPPDYADMLDLVRRVAITPLTYARDQDQQ